MNFRIFIWATILIFNSPAALGDITGASIRYRGVTLQLTVPDDVPRPETKTLLLGQAGAIQSIVLIIAANAGELSKRRIEATIEIDQEANGFTGRLLAAPGVQISGMDGDGIVRFSKPSELIEKLCIVLRVSTCISANNQAILTNRAPDAIRNRRVHANDIAVHLGKLPNANDEAVLWIPDPLAHRKSRREKALDPAVVTTPLPEALEAKGNEIFPDERSDAAPELDQGLRSLPDKPSYLAVHCTAFSAPDDRMELWVKSNKDANRRNKSHGVILASGRYLPMWDFADRRVWATKTETCTQTRAALGSIINIELHYFCARDRQDKASDQQYQALAEIYVQLAGNYGPLKIVSHREIDRGLRDGHDDPIGFSFSRFYDAIRRKGVDLSQIQRISDERHSLRTGPEISHHWVPQLSGALVPEASRSDDCMRDHP